MSKHARLAPTALSLGQQEPQYFGHFPDRLSPMGQAVFFAQIEFGKRAAVWEFKNRIVAKTLFSASDKSNPSGQDALNTVHGITGPKCNDGLEVCGSSSDGDTVHHSQHLRAVVRVSRVFSREPRGAYARRSV